MLWQRILFIYFISSNAVCILCWRPWNLLRFSRCVFISHRISICQHREALHAKECILPHLVLSHFLSHPMQSVYFVGALGISYGLAGVFSLAIEYPFANIEKLFMPKNVQSNRKVDASAPTRENIQWDIICLANFCTWSVTVVDRFSQKIQK